MSLALARPRLLYFPEAERFRGTARGDWFLAFLEAFSTPGSITALDKEAFIAAAWHVVGRKVSKRRLLADIYETAAETITPPVDPHSRAVTMIRMVLAEGRSLIRQRDAIERHAEAMVAENVDYRRLTTIPASARSTRSPSSPRLATCAASTITGSS